MKEKGTCGSHLKKIKRRREEADGRMNRECGKEREFFYFFFSLFLSQIYGNRTVGIRRIKNESALHDEGYAWVPKTQDFTKNSCKILEKS